MRRLLPVLCLTLAVLLGSAGEGFALPPCPSDQNQYYDNCFGTFTFAKSGNKYVGEFRDDHFSGQGTKTYADGTIEEGIWKDDKFHYAQKITPPVVARKSPPPSPSATEIENERLQKRISELEKEKRQKLKPKVATKKEQPPSTGTGTSGSGFFVSKLGHVLTNEHVVRKCKKVTVGDNANRQVQVAVLETDRRNDQRHNIKETWSIVITGAASSFHRQGRPQFRGSY